MIPCSLLSLIKISLKLLIFLRNLLIPRRMENMPNDKKTSEDRALVHNVVLSSVKRAHSVRPEFELERFTIPSVM